MRRVIIRVLAGLAQPDAYARISDFARYEELTSTVRQVNVHAADPDGSVVSDWTVTFRNGLLRWTERDYFEPDRGVIRFTQLTGDFERFEGQWLIEDAPEGTAITFDAVFDLGMPSLADILDPVAEATLRDNVLVILRGLLGEVTVPGDLATAAHD